MVSILEQFTKAKTNSEEDNEDGLVVTADFVAVIDGVTGKGRDKKSGKVAKETIKAALEKMGGNLAPRELLLCLNQELQRVRKKVGWGKGEYPGASVTVYNARVNYLVVYGDCWYQVGKKIHREVQEEEERLAQVRARVLRKAREKGVSVTQLQEHDVGREAILPELREKEKYANTNERRGYACLNGTKVNNKFVRVIENIAPGTEIVLATDGYPKIFGTLGKTEEYLYKCLDKDPLCIKKIVATKGVGVHNISYDDRTYIRFVIH